MNQEYDGIKIIKCEGYEAKDGMRKKRREIGRKS